ncbi:MAG: ABC transporter permease [Verrucomicrobiota bacterium]
MNEPTAYAVCNRTIRPRRGLEAVNFAELWDYRELFLFLAWRDILVRYKQTYLGVAWAVLQPLLMVATITVVFGRMARLSSEGAPYAVMTFAALMPWLLFANTTNAGSASLVAAAGMISKVYFPRLIIPASAVLGGLLDFLVWTVVLGVLMWIYKVEFTVRLLLLPVFLAAALLAALAAGLWLSALHVKYRDVKYVTPFLIQLGAFLSPVYYPAGLVPARWLGCYSLNPMAGAIAGFRWCVLGPQFEPRWPEFWGGLGITYFLLVSGAVFFRSTERTFADVI